MDEMNLLVRIQVFPRPKGDITQDDKQRRFLAQHNFANIVATLSRIVPTTFQQCNPVLR